MKNKIRWGLRDENGNPVYIVFEATTKEWEKINKMDLDRIFGVFLIQTLRLDNGTEYNLNGSRIWGKSIGLNLRFRPEDEEIIKQSINFRV